MAPPTSATDDAHFHPISIPTFLIDPAKYCVMGLDLELELVNSVTLGERPGSSDVSGEVVDLLDVGQQSGVDGLRSRVLGFAHPIVLLRMLTFCSDFLSSDKSFFSCPSPKNSCSLESLPAALDLVK